MKCKKFSRHTLAPQLSSAQLFHSHTKIARRKTTQNAKDFRCSVFSSALIQFKHFSVLINGIDILSVAKLGAFCIAQCATWQWLKLDAATVFRFWWCGCRCCAHVVDDVRSTYVNFIIIIIVLNSNLLNNICHICHLVLCHTESAVYVCMHRPKNGSDVISFGSMLGIIVSYTFIQMETVCRTFAHSFCLLLLFV